jgi:hypothetical protein
MILNLEFAILCLRLCSRSRGLHAVRNTFPATHDLGLCRSASLSGPVKNIGHCQLSKEVRIIVYTVLDVC